MSKFLDDKKLGSAITDLMLGSSPRCAVAFWGTGASSALFPKGCLLASAKVVCDLTMGGTNPAELTALGAPNDERIKHLGGLHAKVYLSNLGLITCSANASNNGIGFLEAAKLIEAGIFHPPTSEAYGSASRWFEKIWTMAAIVDTPALEYARIAWGRKLYGRHSSQQERPLDPASLFDVVAGNPGRFRGVGFVFTTGNATAAQRDETVDAVIAKDDTLRIPVISTHDRKMLAGWPVGNVFSDWEPEDIHAWPQRFICVHQRPNGRLNYYFYERTHTAIIDGERGMVLASPVPGLRKELGFKRGAEAMAKVDAARASLVFDHIAEYGHQLYESGEKLTQLLAEL